MGYFVACALWFFVGLVIGFFGVLFMIHCLCRNHEAQFKYRDPDDPNDIIVWGGELDGHENRHC